jgi:hypothetical protein
MVLAANARRRVAVVAALVLGLACSHNSSRETVTRSPNGPSVAGTVRALDDASPAPAPSATPTARPPVSACPYGKGSLSAHCDRGAPMFIGDVETAVNQLIQQRPDIFDLTHDADTGQYRVYDSDTEVYFAGVVSNLQAMGYCANWDFNEIQVKNSNEFSEQYDILLSSNHIRRGASTYRSTCNPANFPVEAKDFIDAVRVAFFGIDCKDGRTPPHNGEGKLPVGCVGFVTATPKDKNNVDVDARIVNDDILWTLPETNNVLVENFPHVGFNKILTGQAPGPFTLCAVVQGVQGCLNGEVIP